MSNAISFPFSPTISRILDIELSNIVVDDSFWQLDENVKIQMDKTNVEIFFMMLDLETKKQQKEFALSSIYTFSDPLNYNLIQAYHKKINLRIDSIHLFFICNF